RVVLLLEAAGDGRRDGSRPVPGREDAADEAGDPAVAAEARLLRVGAPAEVAAGLEEEPREGPRREPVDVEEGERPEAAAEPGAAARVPELVEGVPEGPGPARRGGEVLEAVGRRHEGDRVRRDRAVVDEPPEQRQEPRPADVVGAVEHDEQRLAARLARAPDSPQAQGDVHSGDSCPAGPVSYLSSCGKGSTCRYLLTEPPKAS